MRRVHDHDIRFCDICKHLLHGDIHSPLAPRRFQMRISFGLLVLILHLLA